MNFKDAMKEDTKVFLNNDEFGVTAFYNGAVESTIINIQEETDDNTGEIYNIGLISKTDTPLLKVNDTFVVGVDTYSVVAIFPLLPTDVFFTARLNRETI